MGVMSFAQQNALYWAQLRRRSRVRSLTLKKQLLQRDLVEVQRRQREAVKVLQPHTRHTLDKEDMSPEQLKLVKAINEAFDLLEWGEVGA